MSKRITIGEWTVHREGAGVFLVQENGGEHYLDRETAAGLGRALIDAAEAKARAARRAVRR